MLENSHPTACVAGTPEAARPRLKQTHDGRYDRIFAPAAHPDIGRKAVRGGVFVMGSEVAAAVLRIASTAVLARMLAPEDFGLLAMVTALTVFAERFKDFGLSDATVQTREITHQQASALFWINLGICVGIMLLVASLARGIAWFYGEPRLTGLALVVAATFVFSGLTIQHHALLRRQLCFGSVALIHVGSILLSIVVAVVMAYYGFGYWALVGREFSRTVFIAAGSWIFCPWIPSRPARGAKISHLLSFGKVVTGYNIVHFVSRGIDKILLGKFYGAHLVGIYVNAYQLTNVATHPLQNPVKTVAFPSLSALQTAPAAFRDYFVKTMQWLAFVCMPAIVMLTLFADSLVQLILGSRWMDAVPFVRILAIGAFADPLVYAVGPAMLALGRTVQYLRLGLVNAFLLLACIGAGSLYGAEGVAIGYAASIYLALVVWFGFGLRRSPINMLWVTKSLFPAFLCSLLTGLVTGYARFLLGWQITPAAHLPLLVLAVCVYLGLWMLMPGGRSTLVEYLGQARAFLNSQKN
jgi:O-antigen/teichoic acid export membrane protein